MQVQRYVDAYLCVGMRAVMHVTMLYVITQIYKYVCEYVSTVSTKCHP